MAKSNEFKKNKKINKNFKKKKNKAFTLIELLAVIIILGILMIIAIPSVTSYISDSRKNAYTVTAKNYLQSARNLVNSNKHYMFDKNTTYYIPVSCIKTENEADSPYGKFVQAYAVVSYNGNNYNYYWISTDTSKMGITLTSENKLDKNSVVSNLDSIETNTAIAPDFKILIMDPNTCTFDETVSPKTIIFSKSADATEKYNLELNNITYDFSNGISYVKDSSGNIIATNMDYVNEHWSSVKGQHYYIFRVYNDINLIKHGMIELAIPKVINKENGAQGQVVKWYYENYNTFYNEKWICSGDITQTSVPCTPEKEYSATNTSFNQQNASYKGKMYLILDDGTYVIVNTKYISYSNIMYNESNYGFPSYYVYGGLTLE